MEKLRKLMRLTPGERRTLSQAMVLLPLTALALKLTGLRRTQRIFSCFIPHDRPHDRPHVRPHVPAKSEQTESDISRAQRISRLVSLARRVYPANCLQRSLTLWWMLRLQGIQSELLFGARKDSGRVLAHAWIEISGVVLNDTEDVRLRYAPFDRAITRSMAEFL